MDIAVLVHWHRLAFPAAILFTHLVARQLDMLIGSVIPLLKWRILRRTKWEMDPPPHPTPPRSACGRQRKQNNKKKNICIALTFYGIVMATMSRDLLLVFSSFFLVLRNGSPSENWNNRRFEIDDEVRFLKNRSNFALKTYNLISKSNDWRIQTSTTLLKTIDVSYCDVVFNLMILMESSWNGAGVAGQRRFSRARTVPFLKILKKKKKERKEATVAPVNW